MNKNLLISKNLRYFMPDFRIKNITILSIMKKYLFFPVIFVLITVSLPKAYGQQDVQLSHNMFNILFYNPAYLGDHGQICMTGLARQQWLGLTETQSDGSTYNIAPQTFLYMIDANINAIRGGIGAVVYKDKLGFEDNIGLKFGYAYRRGMGPGQFSAGLMAGFLNKTIDFGGFVPVDEADPLLQGGMESDMVFDIAGGLFYKVPGQYYAGISSSQLIQSETSYTSPLASPKLKRHYYLTGGYQYTLPNDPSFELLPSILIKTDFVSAQYDINCLVMWNQQFWGGLSYRVNDAFVILAGLNITDSFRFGMSYDATTSSMGSSGRSHGTVEAFLNYCFEIKYTPPVSSYKNVRFL